MASPHARNRSFCTVIYWHVLAVCIWVTLPPPHATGSTKTTGTIINCWSFHFFFYLSVTLQWIFIYFSWKAQTWWNKNPGEDTYRQLKTYVCFPSQVTLFWSLCGEPKKILKNCFLFFKQTPIITFHIMSTIACWSIIAKMLWWFGNSLSSSICSFIFE